MSTTGMRDNILMHPISNLTGIDIIELMKLYRQAPYDSTYQLGNLMNLSEREEFDTIIPFHPLSIIRLEIRESVKKTLKIE